MIDPVGVIRASLALLLSTGIGARELGGEVEYVEGTVGGLACPVRGYLQLRDDDVLSFHTTHGTIRIPYERIRSFARATGVNQRTPSAEATASAAPSRRNGGSVLRILYADDAGKEQRLVFLVPKRHEHLIPQLLEERTRRNTPTGKDTARRAKELQNWSR